MNTFKQKRAVAECKRMRGAGTCPRECCSFHTHDPKIKNPFCKEAFAAEARR